jgi:hypothetical protein
VTDVPSSSRRDRLDPAMAAPALWLASERSDGVAGRRFVASRGRTDLREAEAAASAADDVRWAAR